MLMIGDLLVSEELFEKEFHCNLSKCKGACCVQGDAGAPLKNEELQVLESEYENYKSYLTPEGISEIESKGFHSYDAEDKDYKTQLINGGPCAYVNYDDKGVAVCGIENAHFDGKTTFRKPISCHLYPIRESSVGELKAVNYEEWDICDDACTLGKELKMPLYKFLKEAIIRAYGEDVYEALEIYERDNRP